MKTKWVAMVVVALMVPVLSLLAPNAGAQTPISPGETLTGGIGSPGGSESWTFSAIAGDAIVVRIGEISQKDTFDPRLRLFAPSKAQVGATSTNAVAAEVAVTATET